MKKYKRIITLDMYLVQCFSCSEYYMLESNSRNKYCPGCGAYNQGFDRSDVKKMEIPIDYDDD